MRKQVVERFGQETAEQLIVLGDVYVNGDYLKNVRFEEYFCAWCGVKHVKLWRPYRRPAHALLCIICASTHEEEKVDGMNEKGEMVTCFGMTSEIGNFVPAIPKVDFNFYNRCFWAFGFAPQPALKWWQDLPTFPE